MISGSSKHRPLNLRDLAPLAELVARDPWISGRSRWSDKRWYLDGKTPGRPPFSIHWRLDGVNAELANELKLLAACLLLPRHADIALQKFSNGPVIEIALVYLARFMVEERYESISDLDVAAFAIFRRHLEGAASQPFDFLTSETYPEDDCDEAGDFSSQTGSDRDVAADDIEVDRPTFNFVSLRLKPWSWLHQVQGDLGRAGVAVNAVGLFESRTVASMAMQMSSEGLKRLEDLPDEVILPIIGEAHRLMGAPADQTIWVQDEYLKIGPRDLSIPFQTTDKRNRLVNFLDFKLDGERWLQESGAAGRDPGMRVAEAVRTIRDACLIILNAGIGWRISEAASVEVEPMSDDTALPSCIEIRPSSSGTNEHFWLKGYLSKNQRKPTPTEWLIGARVSGSDAEPMTVRAVRVLERLFRPWRENAPTPFLRRQLVLNWYNSSITFDPQHIVEIRAEGMRTSAQAFIERQVGLAEILKPQVASKPGLAPYYETGGRCIRPHQWRRAFHRMIFRTNPDLGPAISRHFKHLSLAITENGYIARSPAALEESEAVATNELVRLLYERNEADTPAVAGADRILERHRARLSEIIDGDDLENASDRLRGFIERADLRLWPAEHGSCLIGLHPDKAACHVRGGRIDWRVEEPNVERRNPGLCCSCPNFILGKADIPFWQRRYEENRTAWERSGKIAAFRVARDRAHQARTILAHLGAPVPADEIDQTEIVRGERR